MEYPLAAEWIYDHIFDLEAAMPECELLENGQLEMDGPFTLKLCTK